jgi:transcription antitermination factor NusG
MATNIAEIETSASSSGRDVSSSAEWPASTKEFCVPRWYAVYTRAHHEKRVAEQLGVRQAKHFLPLYTSVRRWKDRHVSLELPLFPGYIFVHVALRDCLQVLQIRGVVKLVGFNGTPSVLPQEEIDAIRTTLLRGVPAKPHPYLKVGRRVRVTAGPLAGLEGILVKRKNRARFVVSLELIQRAMAVEVSAADVEGP